MEAEVSARRGERLVQRLGIGPLLVAAMAKELEQRVETFCSRPLKATPSPSVGIDALRQGGLGGERGHCHHHRGPTGTARSWAWTSSRPRIGPPMGTLRMGPAGPASCAGW
jgi:hypothetical protein